MSDSTVCRNLIIGLGGTGKKVLTKVRKHIEEYLGGLENLPVFQLLVIDCEPIEEDTSELPAKKNWLGYEYFYLPFSYEAIEAIEHLIPNKKFSSAIKLIDRESLSQDGTKGNRLLARLAYHLSRKRIYQQLDQTFNKMQSAKSSIKLREFGIDVEPEIRVHIVSSARGGMSGILPDLCCLVKDLLETKASQVFSQVFLYLLLPEYNIDEDEMNSANCYATLSEVDVLGESKTKKGELPEEFFLDGSYRVIENGLFDACCLLQNLNEKNLSASYEELLEMLGSRISMEVLPISSFTIQRIRGGGVLNLLGQNDQNDRLLRYFSFGISGISFPTNLFPDLIYLEFLKTIIGSIASSNADTSDEIIKNRARDLLEELNLGDISSRPKRNDFILRIFNISPAHEATRWSESLINEALDLEDPQCIAEMLRSQTEKQRNSYIIDNWSEEIKNILKNFSVQVNKKLILWCLDSIHNIEFNTIGGILREASAQLLNAAKQFLGESENVYEMIKILGDIELAKQFEGISNIPDLAPMLYKEIANEIDKFEESCREFLGRDWRSDSERLEDLRNYCRYARLYVQEVQERKLRLIIGEELKKFSIEVRRLAEKIFNLQDLLINFREELSKEVESRLSNLKENSLFYHLYDSKTIEFVQNKVIELGKFKSEIILKSLFELSINKIIGTEDIKETLEKCIPNKAFLDKDINIGRILQNNFSKVRDRSIFLEGILDQAAPFIITNSITDDGGWIKEEYSYRRNCVLWPSSGKEATKHIISEYLDDTFLWNEEHRQDGSFYNKSQIVFISETGGFPLDSIPLFDCYRNAYDNLREINNFLLRFWE